MLESFEINNFRLFENLKVERLGRVNLIVGKNNSGKSTFLEAIELYASNASSDVLYNLIDSRQETWLSEVQSSYQNALGHPVRHIFCGHRFPKIGVKEISLGEVSSNAKLHLGTAAYQDKYDVEEGIFRRVRISDIQLEEDLSEVEIFLIAQTGRRTRRLFRLDKGRDTANIFVSSNRLLKERQESEFKYVYQTVSTANMSNHKLAALWDLISLTDLESEVISALGLIDERVFRIAFVEDISKGRENSDRIPLVKLKGIDEPLPLKSLGDGMTRLFHIIVALVNARNGLLLIDEFENGLHWSVQPKVWDIVFQLSARLNVQVFATTHSRDCIKGFDYAWNKYPDLGAFFRLDAKDGFIKATEYTSETLTDAIDMDVEVR